MIVSYAPLIKSIDGDAKRSVKSVGTNGYFYTTSLKVLKGDFDNSLVMSPLKLKKLFNQIHNRRLSLKI